MVSATESTVFPVSRERVYLSKSIFCQSPPRTKPRQRIVWEREGIKCPTKTDTELSGVCVGAQSVLIGSDMTSDPQTSLCLDIYFKVLDPQDRQAGSLFNNSCNCQVDILGQNWLFKIIVKIYLCFMKNTRKVWTPISWVWSFQNNSQGIFENLFEESGRCD